MKTIGRIFLGLFAVLLIALLVVGGAYLLNEFKVVKFGSDVTKYLKVGYVIALLVACIVCGSVFFLLKGKGKSGKNELDASRSNQGDFDYTLEQSFLRERNAIMNTVALIDKNGYNEECINALMERLPVIEDILDQITKFAVDTSLASREAALEKIRSADKLISGTLIGAVVSQAEFEQVLFEATELLHQALDADFEPLATAQDSNAQSFGTTYESATLFGDKDHSSHQNKAPADSKNPSNSQNATGGEGFTGGETLGSKKLKYVAGIIPSTKNFNFRTQSNLGWGESYGGISAQFRNNTTASPGQQELLRRAPRETQQQIIIQTADPQVRKPEKSKSKLALYIGLGVVAIGIVAFIIIAIVQNSTTLG